MNPEDETTKASAITAKSGCDVVTEESDEVLRRLDDKLAARIQAFRESERLSEEDFAIRINARE